jgi:hypothetical protein
MKHIALQALIVFCTGAASLDTNSSLQPWQVTHLAVYSPSGRPGSSAWSTIDIEIENTNQIYAGNTPYGDSYFGPVAVNCSGQWTWPRLNAYGTVFGCDANAGGLFTFRMLPATNATNPSPTTDFDLEFTLVQNKWLLDNVTNGNSYLLSKTWLGTTQFSVGDNMRGLCAASGFCWWDLKTNTTVPITPMEVAESSVPY